MWSTAYYLFLVYVHHNGGVQTKVQHSRIKYLRSIKRGRAPQFLLCWRLLKRLIRTVWIDHEIWIPHSAFLLAEIPLSGLASSDSDSWMLRLRNHRKPVPPTDASGRCSSELDFVVLEAEEMNGKESSRAHFRTVPLHVQFQHLRTTPAARCSL